MKAFLADLFRSPRQARTVLLMDDEEATPRSYHVRPDHLLWGLAVVAALVVACTLIVWALLPGTAGRAVEVEHGARLAALRVEALQDSLRAQQAYMEQLRGLMTGRLDTGATVADTGPTVTGELAKVAEVPTPTDWEDHAQPALPVSRIPLTQPAPSAAPVADTYAASIAFPTLPPVTGFSTRGFDARTGHLALDIAVREGTVVRSIGDGHVVFADYAHDGGFSIAVQHADGYLSVYKHNQRLLKRLGERVRDREAIAISGNTGEVTTGPHLHFELWRDGLAQDPSDFLIGS